MGNIDTGARVVDKRKNWEARIEMAIFKRPSNELSTYDKLVYAILCGHANRDGNAMLYVRTIAEEASCSERQVRRALSALEARHLLRRRHQSAAGQGQTFNIYEVYGFDEYSFKGNPSGRDGTQTPHLPDGHPLPDSHTPPCQSVISPLTEGQAPPDSQAGPINVFEQLLNNSSKEHTIPPTPQRGKTQERGERGGNSESTRPEKQEHDTAGKDESSKPDTEKELFETIREIYNSTLPELTQAERITDFRAKILRRRIRESPERKELSWWEKFFSRVRNFPWPMGKNKNKWQADFDWLIGERGMQKILEGAFLPFRNGAALNEATDEWRELEQLEKKYTNAEGLLDAKAVLREIDATPHLRRLF
jgi:hypothetical protein